MPPPQPPTMDPKMTEVTQMFARFKTAYARNDLNTCVTLLSQLKVHLTQFPSLPALFQQTPNIVEELKLAKQVLNSAQNISGDIYEHAVVLSVKFEDQDAFERDFCQLKPYYMDTWQ
ncbi:26S proteasome non-ATPase regulatory subunit 8 A [Zea mays]|uniref:26S proteasome non-ATPase regulatory subunit 8 A n=1 Tax=Zea mays TaxID=4577 RepID=A0A317YAN8_MAIZE|nr:26S proteasome non-ATPase regulatory subunit 8 A [Zea mays]